MYASRGGVLRVCLTLLWTTNETATFFLAKTQYVWQLQSYLPLSIRGVPYDVMAVVTTGSKYWRLTKTHLAAPLPPTQFRFLVRRSKVLFRFRLPARTRSILDYLKVTCSKRHLTGDEKTSQWTANFSKPLIGDVEELRLVPAFINGSTMVDLFQQGSYVSCTLVAVSLNGGMLLPNSAHASYAVEPIIPEVRLHHGFMKSKDGVIATLLIKKTEEPGLFALIRLSYSSNQKCDYMPEEIVNISTLCQLLFTASGAQYRLTLTVYSKGPENERKASTDGIFVVVQERGCYIRYRMAHGSSWF